MMLDHDTARCPECQAELLNTTRRPLTINERYAEEQRTQRSMGSLQFYGSAALTIRPRMKQWQVLGECPRHGLVRTAM